LGVDRSDRESVQQLDHETSESLKGTWNTDGWADFDQDPSGRMNIDLELASLVDRGVEKRQKALVCNIWSGIADVTIHLPHNTNMLIAVEERVFVLSLPTGSVAAIRGLVGFETGIG
jgi:hypothetical protein